MNKKVKLIIEIAIFIIVIGGIASIYYFSTNNTNKEEALEESVSVGVIKVTDDNFREEVIEADKPVILEFSSNSCPPCVAMLTTLIDIAKNNKEVKVATLNIDSKDCENILEEYPADATPTIMIFHNGEVKSTLVGAVDEAAIMAELE